MVDTYFRSKFEHTFNENHPGLAYEQDKLNYIIPASKHKYCPDFKVNDKLFIETKGVWKPADRKKLTLVLETNPDVEIIMVFQNPLLKATTKLTYAEWCVKNKIRWFTANDPELDRIIENGRHS
jgi:predicted nuclease of restriction endonuclease-like RecB superfamily